MRRVVIIIAALVIIPIIELAVLIAVGQVIGAAWTILLALATSVLGGWLLRREGGRAWRAFQADIAGDRPPGAAATDGLLVLLGGIFMLVPGFVSDVLGLLLIVPPSRRLARMVMMRVFANRISPTAATSLFGPRRVRARAGRPRTPGDNRDRPGHDRPRHEPGHDGPRQDRPRPDRPGHDGRGGDRRAQADAGEPIEGEIIDP